MPQDAIQYVSPGEVHQDPHNPRRDGETPDPELEASIKSLGVLQPVLVREDPVGGFVLIAGERRWRAAVKVKVKAIPIIVKADATPEDILAMQVDENMLRRAMNPMDEARALLRLKEHLGSSQRTVAGITGLSQVTVSRMLRLTKLPVAIQRKVEAGEMSASAALTFGEKRSRSGGGGMQALTDEDYLTAHEAFVQLGKAIRQGKPDRARAEAVRAVRHLRPWLPEGLNMDDADGLDLFDGAGPMAGGPTVKCEYCKEAVPVASPAETIQRIQAMSGHFRRSERCDLAHQRRLRKA